VSTATAPDLVNLREEQLGGHLSKLIEARNFFTGTKSVPIWKELTENPALASFVAEIAFHDLWLWPVTKTHSYLTYGLTIRKENLR